MDNIKLQSSTSSINLDASPGQRIRRLVSHLQHCVNTVARHSLGASCRNATLVLNRLAMVLNSALTCFYRFRGPSDFTTEVLQGREDDARRRLASMGSAPLTLTDLWMKRALDNDCNFSDAEFSRLPSGLKRQVHQVANVFVHRELLMKLRGCGMYQEAKFSPGDVRPFSANMDAIDVETRVSGFISTLRQQGRLQTEEEYGQRGWEKYYSYDSLDCLDRLFGRDHIERTIQQMGCRYVKVPRMIAVIDSQTPSTSELQYRANYTMTLYNSRGIVVRSEWIEPVKRDATREEMIELLDFVEAIHFADCLGNNFFIGRNQDGVEGIFCVDTETGNFAENPDYRTTSELENLMGPDDQIWFQEELQRREASRTMVRKVFDGIRGWVRFWLVRPVMIEHGHVHRHMFKARPFKLGLGPIIASQN